MLWGGRFKEKLSSDAFALNASIQIDKRMVWEDILGSLAWSEALFDSNVLSHADFQQIQSGLSSVLSEVEENRFKILPLDEDIHSAVERRLVELIGPVGGKLHTGRSRNDQVVTDFRLWVMHHVPNIEEKIKNLQQTFISRAEADFEIILPGYTHLQPAQPILLSHWWLSHFWPLQRDRDRLGNLFTRTAILPLGSGALAGNPFNVNRHKLAETLGFLEPSPNSLDAVSDRDFALEFLFITSLIGNHLSRLAETIIIFSNPSFGFFEQSEAYSTGSSLMPQKKNPDIFELARGKAGVLLGLFTGLFTSIKGLPSAYDKDLQEDKQAVFSAYDTIVTILHVLSGAVQRLNVHPTEMLSALEPGLMATDLADYLVEKGIPFREAHQLTGHLVQRSFEVGRPISAMSLQDFQAIHSAIEADVYEVFSPQRSVSRRKSFGGTAPEAVKEQISLAKVKLLESFTKET